MRPCTRYRSALATSDPLPFLTASTQMSCWPATTVGSPSALSGPALAFGTDVANAVSNWAPSGAVNIVSFGRYQACLLSLLTTVMAPPALGGFRFSYRAGAPASRLFPSGSSIWPAQNRSQGV